MRTHFLSSLSIDGKDKVLAMIPAFDFYRLGRVTSLSIDSTADSVDTHLTLTAEYEADTASKSLALVTLCFAHVRRAILPAFSPSFFLAELEIEDVRESQLEGIRYIAKCYGDEEFEVVAGEISIVGCRMLVKEGG